MVAFHRDEAALEESKRRLSGTTGRQHGPDGGAGDASDASANPWWKKRADAKAKPKSEPAGASTAAAKAAAKASSSQ